MLEDISLINRVLKVYPEITDVIYAIQIISPKVVYPIQNFDELSNALREEDQTMFLENHSFNFMNVIKNIPKYYFPVISENDLITKLADLRSRMPSGSEQISQEADLANSLNLLRGERLDAPPAGEKPPNISGEEIQAKMKINPLPIGGFY